MSTLRVNNEGEVDVLPSGGNIPPFFVWCRNQVIVYQVTTAGLWFIIPINHHQIEAQPQQFILCFALSDYISSSVCFSRDTSLLKTSRGSLAWLWISSTVWPCGRRTTWRRRRGFFETGNEATSQLASVLSGRKRHNKNKTHLKYLYMHRHDTLTLHL